MGDVVSASFARQKVSHGDFYGALSVLLTAQADDSKVYGQFITLDGTGTGWHIVQFDGFIHLAKKHGFVTFIHASCSADSALSCRIDDHGFITFVTQSLAERP